MDDLSPERQVRQAVHGALRSLPSLTDRPIPITPGAWVSQPIHQFDRIVAASSVAHEHGRSGRRQLADHLLATARRAQQTQHTRPNTHPLVAHNVLVTMLAELSGQLERSAAVTGYLQDLDAPTVIGMVRLAGTLDEPNPYYSAAFPTAIRALASALARHRDLPQAEEALAVDLACNTRDLTTPHSRLALDTRSPSRGHVTQRCWVVPLAASPVTRQLRDELFGDPSTPGPLAGARTAITIARPTHPQLAGDITAMTEALHTLMVSERNNAAFFDPGAPTLRTLVTDVPGLAVAMTSRADADEHVAPLHHVLCIDRTEHTDQAAFPRPGYAGQPRITVVQAPPGGDLPLREVAFPQLAQLARHGRRRETAARSVQAVRTAASRAVTTTRGGRPNPPPRQ